MVPILAIILINSINYVSGIIEIKKKRVIVMIITIVMIEVSIVIVGRS